MLMIGPPGCPTTLAPYIVNMPFTPPPSLGPTRMWNFVGQPRGSYIVEKRLPSKRSAIVIESCSFTSTIILRSFLLEMATNAPIKTWPYLSSANAYRPGLFCACGFCREHSYSRIQGILIGSYIFNNVSERFLTR